MISREGFDAYGIDAAPTGLALCQKTLGNWGQKATLALGDMRELPFKPDYFDAIVDIVSLQHLDFEGHRTAWNQIYKCLKPGEYFFSYHLGENSIPLQSIEDKENMIDHCTVKNIPKGLPLENNGPTSFLSANEARKYLSEIGFVNSNIEKVTRSYLNQRMHLEYLVITMAKKG